MDFQKQGKIEVVPRVGKILTVIDHKGKRATVAYQVDGQFVDGEWVKDYEGYNPVTIPQEDVAALIGERGALLVENTDLAGVVEKLRTERDDLAAKVKALETRVAKAAPA